MSHDRGHVCRERQIWEWVDVLTQENRPRSWVYTYTHCSFGMTFGMTYATTNPDEGPTNDYTAADHRLPFTVPRCTRVTTNQLCQLAQVCML